VRISQARPIPQPRPLPRAPRPRADDGKVTPASREPRARRDRGTPSPSRRRPRLRPLPEATAVHATSNAGLRARAIGGANGGSPRCARMATTTSLSEMSATIARLPPHRHAKTSTQSMRRRSWPTRSASHPASRRRPRGSSAGGSARPSRRRCHARATSPRRSLRTATRRRASSRSASSSWRAATSPSPQLSPARAGLPPRAAASAARTPPTSAGVETGAAESSSIVVPKIASASSRGASHRYASACGGDTPRGHPAASTGAPSLILGARRSGTSVPILRGRPSAR
jgi:hypothetical protein